MLETRALEPNKTWTLVPRASDNNILCSKWVFHKTKLKFDGSVDWLRACLVARSYTHVWELILIKRLHISLSQLQFCIVLFVATTKNFDIYNLLSKIWIIFLKKLFTLEQLASFTNSKLSSHTCRVKHALYCGKKLDLIVFLEFGLIILLSILFGLAFFCCKAASSLLNFIWYLTNANLYIWYCCYWL